MIRSILDIHQGGRRMDKAPEAANFEGFKTYAA